MTCLKGVRRSAMVALAPDAPYVAAGTMAGAFSSSANLEIFELHFQSYDWELPLAGEAPSSEHFNRLSWGRAAAGSASEHFSLGLVAGGLVDGTINIWNPLTLIRPEANGNALVSHLSRHRGPVRGLEFNAIAPNLLGSGADDGEICIWDMANPAEPSHFTPPRGGGSTSQGEISFLSWNSNETHILASTSYNGTTVVWDLKKQKPVIGFSDSVRRRCSVLQWNPDVATQLVVASDEDSSPSVRLWDTRNTMSPVKEFAGHTKGVIAMAWCPDSSYLITCAKDSRTICWDTVSGEIVCELPAGNNWNFDVHWYPKIPGVISASSFDGKVGFYNIEGCSRYSVGENEFGAEGQMKNKEEELNSIIMELRKNYASLQEKSTEEEMETLAAVDSLAKLKEARLNFERSLSEEPSKAQRELLSSNLKEQCSSQNDEIRRLQNKLATAENDEIRRLQNKLATVEEKLQLYSSYAPVTRTEFEGQKKLTNELKNRLADAELKVVEGEKLCKKLHNTILELKGNIRVFCRVRPVLPVDGGISTEGNVLSYPTSIERIGRGIDVEQSGQKHAFTFDQVFMPDTTQADVFVQISELVQSALDGYKVCIFAYGQKGSGKTYTMMGRPGHPEQKGLIPRSLEQIFQTRQSLQPQGWRYEMQVSILEIYNETIRDLISTIQSSATEGKQYAIKHDANGNTYVSDLTIVDVCSAKEVSFLLDQAVQSRSVGKTQMNEQSSRSHFVFMLRILGLHESTKQQVKGVLNLIDLAGSERLSNSGATGDQLKETQAINKSLSFLSDVILALEKKEDHIPFRNSKLTYLLQPCLGGDSKTLMFVNVSSNPSSVGESLCALRFAARVNACEIGIPQRQTNMRPSDSLLRNG